MSQDDRARRLASSFLAQGDTAELFADAMTWSELNTLMS